VSYKAVVWMLKQQLLDHIDDKMVHKENSQNFVSEITLKTHQKLVKR